MLTGLDAAVTTLKTDIGTVTAALVGAAIVALAGRWIVARFF